MDNTMSRLAVAVCALCCALAAGATAAGRPADYLKRIERLSGVHPHDLILPDRVGAFRATFATTWPHLARRFAGSAKEFDAELMPEPPATRNKVEFIETMDRIRRFCGRMDRFAQAYLATGDKRYGKQATRILLHIAKWNPEAGGGFRACDEVPMGVMQLCPRVYDWTYDLLTPAERKLVRASLRERGRRMYRRIGSGRNLPTDSHGGRMLGFMGEAGVVFYGEFPEAKQWLSGIVGVMQRQYPKWGGSDGGWAEGPNYWAWYMGYIIPFLTSLDTAASSNPLLDKPFFRNTGYFGLYCAPATLRHRPFGDGADYRLSGKGYGASLTQCRNARFFGTVYRDGHLIWDAGRLRSKTTFHEALTASAGRPPVKAVAPSDLPQSRHFADIDWVAMHSALAKPGGDVFLLFKSSPYGSTSHSHADQNAFALFAYGQPLAIASGYYDYYNSPHHRGWTRQTKANNAVLVDGQGQLERGGRAKIESFVTDGLGDGVSYTRGNALGAYAKKLTLAERHCVKIDGATYVLIDDLAAPRPATFSWLIHALEKMDVTDKGGVARLAITRDGVRCGVNVAASQPVTASQTNRFAPPPLRQATIKTRGKPNRPDQWHATVTTAKKAKAGAFIARLAVAAKDGTPQRFTNDSGLHWPTFSVVSWKSNGETLTLAFAKGGKPASVRSGDLAFTGRLAMVRGNRRLLVGGTGLTWRGKMLVKASSAVTVAVNAPDNRTLVVGLGEGRKGAAVEVAVPDGVTIKEGRWQPDRPSDEKPPVFTVGANTVTIKHPGKPGRVTFRARD
jgi:heparinase II/III-like protein/uncharacterized protein DUF4962